MWSHPVGTLFPIGRKAYLWISQMNQPPRRTRWENGAPEIAAQEALVDREQDDPVSQGEEVAETPVASTRTSARTSSVPAKKAVKKKAVTKKVPAKEAVNG